MTKVTVDLADLETLVFATGVIKQIEGQLASYKSDPFVKPHLNYTSAVNNLVTAMNSAKRGSADTVINWNDPISKFDEAVLQHFEEATALGLEIQTGGMREGTVSKEFQESVNNLVCKGYLEKGQSVSGAIWSSSTTPELRPLPVYRARITKRGIDKLNENRS